MTALVDFLAGRGPAEMYETYWVPGTLWPHAVGLVEVVRPGDAVLDVGAGTGLVTELAAARAGTAGHVTAVEPTPFMAEHLRARHEAAPHITVTEAGVEDLAGLDDHFDVVLCHQVLQFVADPADGFVQLASVLKPGGRLAAGVWSGPSDQVVSVLEDGFGTHLGPQFVPVHAWAFGGLPRLEELAGAAGLVVDVLEMRVHSARFESIEHMMNVHLTGGMRVEDGEVLMGIFDLADESFTPKVAAMLADLTEQLADYESADGLIIPWASDVVVATKPS